MTFKMKKKIISTLTLTTLISLSSCNINDSDTKNSSTPTSSSLANTSSNSKINSSSSQSYSKTGSYEIGNQWVFEYYEEPSVFNSNYYNWQDTLTVIDKFNSQDTVFYETLLISGGGSTYRDTLTFLNKQIISSPTVKGPSATWQRLDIFKSLDSNIIWQYDSEYSRYNYEVDLGYAYLTTSVQDTTNTDRFSVSLFEIGSNANFGSYSNLFGLIHGSGSDSEDGNFKYNLLEVNFMKDKFELIK